MGASKSKLVEQPVPKALGPKTQPLQPGRAAATFSANPDPAVTNENQLMRWVAMLVGEENRECVMGIFEAVLILVGDIVDITTAISGGGDAAAGIPPMQILFKDIITIAISLPPKCLKDDHLASVFSKVFEIIQLSRGDYVDPIDRKLAKGYRPQELDPLGTHAQPIGGMPPGLPSKLEMHQHMVELIQSIPGLEILEKYPGLAEQIADKLTEVANNYDLDTQADILVTLLPNDALKELDEALNKPASELPGAGFIEKLNQYDNQLGLDIIPDAVINAPAVDLLIRTAGVTGMMEEDDVDFLLGLTTLLRYKISSASNRSALDRVKSFVQILMDPSSPPVQIAPEEPSVTPKPVKVRVTPDPEGLHLREHRARSRWKVLAGIR